MMLNMDFISSQTSFDNTNAMLNDDEPLYIATDETKEGFFKFIEDRHPV